MQYSQLGTSGTFVSRLCLGTMTFGGNANPIGNLSLEEADRIVGRAIDAGINFIDTADVYTGGGSEPVVAQIWFWPARSAAASDPDRTMSASPGSISWPGSKQACAG
jgi:aryl-alcohol dehydrogenase-like predicted oxidoreductase